MTPQDVARPGVPAGQDASDAQGVESAVGIYRRRLGAFAMGARRRVHFVRGRIALLPALVSGRQFETADHFALALPGKDIGAVPDGQRRGMAFSDLHLPLPSELFRPLLRRMK